MERRSNADIWVVIFAAWLFLTFLLAGPFLAFPRRLMTASEDPYWLAVILLGVIGGVIHALVYAIVPAARFESIAMSALVGIAAALGCMIAIGWGKSPISHRFADPTDSLLVSMLLTVSVSVSVFVGVTIKRRRTRDQ